MSLKGDIHAITVSYTHLRLVQCLDAFDELAGLVVEVTPPAPAVSDAEGEEPSASEAELALEKYGDEPVSYTHLSRSGQ